MKRLRAKRMLSPQQGSLTSALRQLSTGAFRSAPNGPVAHAAKRDFPPRYQMFMASSPFLDSGWGDQYGPRGFKGGGTQNSHEIAGQKHV